METKDTLQDPLHTLDNDKLAKQAFDNQSDLSKGIIDFKRIFAQAEEAGIKHFIVERDRTSDVGTIEREEVVIRDGFDYMNRVFS
jgi:sugar phosphate isomerase/epimerase